ncbi:low-complexity tail membrane protein [Pseudanabaena biceps]|nr:low-complexity tail membrane protein [Pseudanabaena biceps]
MTLPNPNASQKPAALKNNPFIWGNIVLLAGVPWLLGQSMAGLAVGNPVFPAWFEILLLGFPVIALGAWLQWQQPLYPFNLWFVSKPVENLSDRDRQVLTLIRQHRNGWYMTGWIGLSVALVMGLVFFKMYTAAPLAQEIAPFPAGLRLLGIVWAEVFLLIGNVLLQSGISAIRIQFTDASELSSLSPFAVERVKNSFTNISWRSPLFLKFFEESETVVTLNESKVSESVTENQPETIDQPIIRNELVEKNDINEVLEVDNQDKLTIEELEIPETNNLNDDEVIDSIEEVVTFNEELYQDNYLSELVTNESIETILNTEANDDITVNDLKLETVVLDDIPLSEIEEPVAELIVDLEGAEDLLTEVLLEENVITNELAGENDIDEISELDSQDILILEDSEMPEITNLNDDKVVDFIKKEVVDFAEEIDGINQQNYLSEAVTNEAVEIILNTETNDDITVDDLEVEIVDLDDSALLEIEEPVAESPVDINDSEDILTEATLEENLVTEFEQGLIVEDVEIEVLDDSSFELLETTEAIANLETINDASIALEPNIILSNEIFVEVSSELETQEPSIEAIADIKDSTIEMSGNSPEQLVEENPAETSIVAQPAIAELKFKKKPTELLYKSGKPSNAKKQRGFGKSTKSITTTSSIIQPDQQSAQSEIESIDDIPQEEDEASSLNVYVENILQEYLEDQFDELDSPTDLEVAIAEAVEDDDIEAVNSEPQVEKQFTDSQDRVSSHLLYESLVDQFLEKLGGLNKEDRKNQATPEEPQSEIKVDEVDEFADLEALLDSRTFPQSTES